MHIYLLFCICMEFYNQQARLVTYYQVKEMFATKTVHISQGKAAKPKCLSMEW